MISFLPGLPSSTPFSGTQRGGRGSGEPIEVFGNLQHCSPRVGIGQLVGHLSRLLRTVEPFQGFLQNRRILVPPYIVRPGSSYPLF
jgi:hypothetical protein